MLTGISTRFQFKLLQEALLTIIFCILFSGIVTAQVITVPSANTNDTSTRKPLGCFYGYERTELLFTATEIGQGGTITKVGFYLNSLNNPSATTPVIIKMKSFVNSQLSAGTYANAVSGATQVYSGTITSSMLNANSWVTITLNTPFDYSSNNLAIFIETNYGEFGNETFDAKQFRHSNVTSNRCQFWEDDLVPPTDNGILTKKRPNIQITFEPECTGTPNPGNTISTANPVCSGEPFTLSLQNTSTTPGIIYEWQSSTSGGGLGFNAIPGATASTLITSETAPLYYRCKVTCTASGLTANSNELHVTLNPFYLCYCASYAFDISDSKIDSVKMGPINTSSPPLQCESYTDYTGSPAAVTAGQEMTLKVANGSCSGLFYQSYLAVYVDFNQNGVFDEATELLYSYGPTTYFHTIPDYTFIFPVDAPGGTTGMRVILQEGDSIPHACGEYVYGETEDYLLNITAAAACNAAPNPGATLSTKMKVCPNEQFDLSISNYQNNTGIGYQWQWSSDNTTWNAIGGATSAMQVDSQTVATYYRCKVTCLNTGQSAFSASVFVDMKPFYACYCESGPLNPEDTKIDTVQIGNLITGSSTTSCETYTDYTELSADISKSGTNIIKIMNGSCSGDFDASYVAVYIDYNQNQLYDTDELVYSFGPTTDLNTIPDGEFDIPAAALLGITGLRIVLAESETVPAACGSYDWGETEDYAVNIVELPTCISPPDAGTSSASTVSFCPTDVPADITLEIAGYSGGTGQTYQWESSPDGNAWTPITGATDPTATTSVTATTFYHCLVTCTGNSSSSTVTEVEVKSVPIGNTQADPIVIPSTPYTDLRDNLTSNCWTSDYTNLTAQPSPDVFYELFLDDTSGTLDISTCETVNFDTYLHLIDNLGNHLSSNNGNGLLCAGVQASIKYPITTVPITVYIIVEGFTSDEGAYQLDVNFIPDSATGIISNPSLSATNFSLYPNPTDANVNIQVNLGDNVTKTADLNLYNGIGQLVQTQQVALVHGKYSGTIHLNPSLAQGIYRMQLNDGSTILTKQVVIQR